MYDTDAERALDYAAGMLRLRNLLDEMEATRCELLEYLNKHEPRTYGGPVAPPTTSIGSCCLSGGGCTHRETLR